MSKKLIYLRYTSWLFIIMQIIYIIVDSFRNPSRAELLFDDFGANAYKEILWKNNYASVPFILLLLVGILLFVIVVAMGDALTQKMRRAVLALSQFMLCSSIWVLTDSYLLSFITSNTAAVAMLSYVVFTVMFAFVFEFIGCVLFLDKVVTVVSYTLYILEAFTYLNFFYPLVDRAILIGIVHAVTILTSIYIIFHAMKLNKVHNDNTTRFIFFGFLSLSVFGIFALMTFYFDFGLKYSVIFSLGVVVFCFCLTLAAIYTITQNIVEKANEDAYKKLAFTDEMTGLKNKTAYVQFEKQPLKDGSIFIMLDLNNLKYINDKYGHRMGDEVITRAANYITKFFPAENCYRFGGDEFVVTLNDMPLIEVEKRLKDMKDKMVRDNEKRLVQIEFAIGYAKQKDGDNVQSIFLRADQNMYKDKNTSANSRDNFS